MAQHFLYAGEGPFLYMRMFTADYIVGLTDGEGSFTAFIRSPNKRHQSVHFRVQCHYYIKLRDDDVALLRKVQKFFGIGTVVFQKDNRPNHHHAYRFHVTNLKDLSKHIIPFFKRHKLQSKRITDFNLFCRIVDAVMRNEHQNSSGLAKIQKWKKQMHQYRTR